MKNRIAAIVFMLLFASSYLNALTPNEQELMQDLDNRAQAVRNQLDQIYLAVPLTEELYRLRDEHRGDLRALTATAYLMLDSDLLTPEMQNELNEFINRTEQYLREEAGRNFRRRPEQQIRDRLSARGRVLNLFPELIV